MPERPKLSSQQRVILLNLRDGLSYENVAGRLGISKSSVKTHIRRMYKTLNVNNAKDAIDKAEALGLLEGVNF